MAASLEETLISVWQQVMIENASSVKLENRSFPVRLTSRSKLRELDFQFEGYELRGLEQNPKTASRWAQLARRGKKGDAVSTAAALHCGRGRSQSAVLWRGGIGSKERLLGPVCQADHSPPACQVRLNGSSDVAADSK